MRLNPDQEDALREVVNIGIGRAASTLSDLIGTRIELAVPRVSLLRLDDVTRSLANAAGNLDVAIVQDFQGPVSGRAALVLPHSSGLRLAQLLGEVAQPVDELDLELTGILTEVGNIMLNSVLGVLANILEISFAYSVPQFYGNWPAALLQAHTLPIDDALLAADADFWVRDDSIRGSILVATEPEALRSLIEALGPTA